MPIIYKEVDMSINYGRRGRSTSFCAAERQKTVRDKTQRFLLQYYRWLTHSSDLEKPLYIPPVDFTGVCRSTVFEARVPAFCCPSFPFVQKEECEYHAFLLTRGGEISVLVFKYRKMLPTRIRCY